MSLYEQIEPAITGTSPEKKRRKERLKTLLDAFEKCGQELVTSELAADMETIQQKFESELDSLEAKL